MAVEEKYVNRFKDLIEAGERVNGTAGTQQHYIGETEVDHALANEWGVSVLSLLGAVFGKDSEYYISFNKLFENIYRHRHVQNGLGILKAAEEDYQKEMTTTTKDVRPDRVFLSRGRSGDWREVQAYIERDLQIKTLELAQQANKGRTVLQKLDEESGQCSFAVVVMTGDDDLGTENPRARENVMHEIGYFQGKFGLNNVCILYEEGTNIPSNIHGLVYVSFPKGMVRATFGDLARELREVFPST